MTALGSAPSANVTIIFWVMKFTTTEATPSTLAAVSSIVVGGVVSLLCVFGILPIPVDAIIVGMSASFIDYVVVALVTGKKEG